MTKHILVTGGAGYIGSHTCKLLTSAGYTPVVLDNLVYGHESFVKWGPFIKGDSGDTSLLDNIFNKFSPAAVIHFAAYAYVGESVVNPAKYYVNNVSGTINLLEAMRRHDCSHMVFSSSCATYGIPEYIPINESHPQQPINPYGMSKMMVEKILADYDLAYDLRSISLRYFNAAGADFEAELGEDHTPETHLIPLVFYHLLGKTKKLEIFGSDYDTDDGTAVRDYVHVSDLADAHLKSLMYLQENNRSERLNLGTGTGLSVNEIVRAVENITGETVPVAYAPRRKGDPPKLIADPARAFTMLGWKARNSTIDTIVETAWNWHRKRHG